jgi:hypothetical protein
VLAPAIVLSVAAILIFGPNIGWLKAIWQVLAVGVVVLALLRLVVRAARTRQRVSRTRQGRRVGAGVLVLVYGEFLLAVVIPGVAGCGQAVWTGRSSPRADMSCASSWR